MQEPDFSMDEVLAGYSLPGRVVTVGQVARAWSNRVFRLQTTHGAYAVKQLLNPWHDPQWRDWLAEAAAFELAAHRAGIAMPQPVLTADQMILVDLSGETEQVTVRVHEWVDGQACADGPVDADVARQVGADLARTHALDHHPMRSDVFPKPNQDNIDGWDALVDRLMPRAAELAAQAAAAGPHVRQIGELLQQAVTDFAGYPMSHGDVDQKNLIITDRGPVLCDWDVSAPWPPRQELARTAVSLASWQRPAIARATIAGYRSAGGGVITLEPADLAVDLRIGLDWLCLCLERAAGLRDDGAQRRAEATADATGLLRDLGPRVQQVLTIDSWLSQ